MIFILCSFSLAINEAHTSAQQVVTTHAVLTPSPTKSYSYSPTTAPKPHTSEPTQSYEFTYNIDSGDLSKTVVIITVVVVILIIGLSIGLAIYFYRKKINDRPFVPIDSPLDM